jgi:hypothetical protein
VRDGGAVKGFEMQDPKKTQDLTDYCQHVPESWTDPHTLKMAEVRRRNNPRERIGWPRTLLPGAFVFFVVFVIFCRPPEHDFNIAGLVAVAMLLATFITPVYLIPTFLAEMRRHRNYTAVMLLNVFGGWTVLGWIAALVWSVVEQERGK